MVNLHLLPTSDLFSSVFVFCLSREIEWTVMQRREGSRSFHVNGIQLLPGIMEFPNRMLISDGYGNFSWL